MGLIYNIWCWWKGWSVVIASCGVTVLWRDQVSNSTFAVLWVQTISKKLRASKCSVTLFTCLGCLEYWKPLYVLWNGWVEGLFSIWKCLVENNTNLDIYLVFYYLLLLYLLFIIAINTNIIVIFCFVICFRPWWSFLFTLNHNINVSLPIRVNMYMYTPHPHPSSYTDILNLPFNVTGWCINFPILFTRRPAFFSLTPTSQICD